MKFRINFGLAFIIGITMLLSVACAKVNKYAKVENDNLAGSIVLNDANKKLDIDEKEGEKQEKSTSMSTLED